MAQRRMISLQIADTDAFLEMPPTSQLLYFHLTMRADDEGFVNNPRRISKLIGAQDDDLKVLIAKRFVLTFESGVVVIKHWLIHNTIRMDRFKETVYQDEKNSLTVKRNKSYTELETKRQPVGNQLATQVKLSKVKLSKDKLSAKADNPTLNLNMDLQKFIEWCKRSPQRHINIIADYADEKKVAFETKGQWQEFIRRNLRPAKSLAPYTDRQIGEAMAKLNKAKKEYLTDWTLETLNKFLDK